MKYLRSFLLAVVAITLGLVFTFASQPEQAAAQSNRQVWAFYMGFWNGGAAWDAQANVLSDYPLIGKYDSRDGGVAGAQIDQAKGAGIDAFIVSWFGPEDVYVTNPALNNMLDRAAERGFKIGVAIDMFNGDFGRDRIVNALKHTMGNLINRPAYLRYNGKPVIFFAFQSASGFSTSAWQSIRNEVDPGHTTIWIAEGLSGCCLYGGAMEGMYAFNMAWNNGRAARYISERNAITNWGGQYYIPTIHPGWDEAKIAQRDHRPNPTSPRSRADGQFLTNTWNGAAAAGTDVILVVSWNEFMENSHIEPSTLYGTQSLDILRGLVPGWKAAGSAAPPSGGAPTGQYVEARQSIVNVRSGPGTNYSIIGQIRPGAQYAILGESGSWWAIAYGDRTGYVIKSLVNVTGGGPSTPPAAPGSPTGQMVEAYSVANVRTGPGTNYAIIGQIRAGTRYPVIGESGNWWMITYNGQTGYVYKPAVRVTAGVPSTPTPTPAPGAAHGLSDISFSLRKTSFHTNEEIWFDFFIRNSGPNTLNYGLLGAQVFSESGAHVVLQGSWTGSSLKPGHALKWDDHFHIGAPGKYRAHLIICYTDLPTCNTPAGQWELLSPGVWFTVG